MVSAPQSLLTPVQDAPFIGWIMEGTEAGFQNRQPRRWGHALEACCLSLLGAVGARDVRIPSHEPLMQPHLQVSNEDKGRTEALVLWYNSRLTLSGLITRIPEPNASYAF